MNPNNSFEGLRTCIFKVGDMKRARTWYAKAFNTEPYFEQPYYIGFNISGYELGLQPAEPGKQVETDNVMTYWGVKDVAQKFKELIESGALMHERPQNVGGEIIVASVRDPWGNVIGLIHNPEFKLP